MICSASSLALQQANVEEAPVLIKEHWFYGGRIIIEPANQDSQTKVMDIIKNKVTVSNHPFIATLATALPPTATLVFRTEAPGKVEDLLLDPARGVGRLNGWPAEARKGLRILNWPSGNSGIRFTRVACTEEVVNLIKEAEGVLYCGVGQATVQWKKQRVCAGLEVTFGHH